MIILCILLFGFGIVLWLKVAANYEQPINHVNLFTVSWLFVCIGALFFPLEVKLLPETYIVLIISWIFFLLGSYKRRYKEIGNQSGVGYNFLTARLVLFFLVVLSVISYISSLGDILSGISNIQTWALLRRENLYSESTSDNIFYTLFARNYSLYIPLAVYLFYKGELKKIYFFLILVYGLLTSIINFSRAPLLELIIVTVISITLVRELKRIPIVRVIVIIVLFTAFFTLTQSVLYSFNTYATFDPFYEIKMYLFGGINNYQILLQGNYPDHEVYSSSFYSLDFINYILERLGFIKSYPNLVREWNGITESNVYTYLDAFTFDFGFLGAFFGSLLIGLIGKGAYAAFAKNKTIFSITLYSLVCYYVVMSFSNNEFIRFSFLLFVIKILLVEFICRKKSFKHGYN